MRIKQRPLRCFIIYGKVRCKAMSIIAEFKNGKNKTYTQSLYQHDKGQILEFVGVEDLPEEFEVHFSNDKDYGTASVVVGKNRHAAIPNAYLATGSYIYAWVHVVKDITYCNTDYSVEDEILIEERDDPVTFTRGTTMYEVVIPVIKRAIEIRMPMPGIGDPANEYSIKDGSLIIN